MTGIGLRYNNLSGVNLAGQSLANAAFNAATLTNANLSQANLTNANFVAANLSSANLSQANLTNAYFSGFSYPVYDENGEVIDEVVSSPGANFTGANLSGADARGATFYLATLSGANTSNLIQSDGHIAGLDLTSGASLVVRDYENYAGIDVPILVDQHLAMDATGTLRLVFDADLWDSTVSFAPGIPVALGGTLELLFAADVDLAGQLGRTLDLFDWTGVSPSGAFGVSSLYTWDLTMLYTTGEVTLTELPFPGDANGDHVVDFTDLGILLNNYSQAGTFATGDFNNSGNVDFTDLGILLNNYNQTAPVFSPAAAVPEPNTLVLAGIGAIGLIVATRRKRAGRAACCQ